MALEGLKITAVDIRAATDAEYEAANAFSNAIRAESMPDDPPIPLDEFVVGCKHIPEQVDVFAWMVWSEACGELVGSGNTGIAHFGHNDHIAHADIAVSPEFRNRGIGRVLLREIANIARQEKRSLLFLGSKSRVPAGDAFLEAIGAERGLVSHMNQLAVDELDLGLFAAWQATPDGKISEFDVVIEQGPYAENELSAITDMLNEAYNTIPRGDLKMDDHKFSPEQMRQFEKSTFVGGRERWTAFARHRQTNAYAGFTEVGWHPNRPMFLSQHGTAVLPQYRHKGLGRRLKAALLEKLLEVHPEIKFVRTDNAYVNAAMLEINNAMGFKPYQTETAWQIETEKVFDYLNRELAV